MNYEAGIHPVARCGAFARRGALALGLLSLNWASAIAHETSALWVITRSAQVCERVAQVLNRSGAFPPCQDSNYCQVLFDAAIAKEGSLTLDWKPIDATSNFGLTELETSLQMRRLQAGSIEGPNGRGVLGAGYEESRKVLLAKSQLRMYETSVDVEGTDGPQRLVRVDATRCPSPPGIPTCLTTTAFVDSVGAPSMQRRWAGKSGITAIRSEGTLYWARASVSPTIAGAAGSAPVSDAAVSFSIFRSPALRESGLREWQRICTISLGNQRQ